MGSEITRHVVSRAKIGPTTQMDPDKMRDLIEQATPPQELLLVADEPPEPREAPPREAPPREAPSREAPPLADWIAAAVEDLPSSPPAPLEPEAPPVPAQAATIPVAPVSWPRRVLGAMLVLAFACAVFALISYVARML